MRMVQIGQMKWAVYSKQGFVVIITSDKAIAEYYADEKRDKSNM
jgi:hypothetical protein